MDPFTRSYYDEHTGAWVPPEAADDHDTFQVLRCAEDDSRVTIRQVGTSEYAECREGHRWQNTYTGAWIARP